MSFPKPDAFPEASDILSWSEVPQEVLRLCSTRTITTQFGDRMVATIETVKGVVTEVWMPDIAAGRMDGKTLPVFILNRGLVTSKVHSDRFYYDVRFM